MQDRGDIVPLREKAARPRGAGPYPRRTCLNTLLSVIDVAAQRVVKSVPVGGLPWGVVAAP